jgi:hypothetical protein
MTKAELVAVLANVPDDAEVSVMGADIRVVAYSAESGYVVLDETPEPFEDGPHVFLYRDDDGDGLLLTPEEEERASALVPEILRALGAQR